LLRFAISLIMGFVLIVVEAMIVMKLKNYTAIDLSNIQQMVGVYAMNFFLVFAILTDVKRWLENQEESTTQIDS
jgi:antibiotic biosynthesis monooxygenase (ABM) superfamily enzyme